MSDWKQLSGNEEQTADNCIQNVEQKADESDAQNDCADVACIKSPKSSNDSIKPSKSSVGKSFVFTPFADKEVKKGRLVAGQTKRKLFRSVN